MKLIHSERLTLIPLTEDQLRMAVWSWRALEEEMGLTPTETVLGEPVKNAIAAKLHKMGEDPANLPWITYWLIVEKVGQRASGLLGFKGTPDDAGRVEIGYGTFHHAQGRGFMTEAVQRLVDWALQQRHDLTVVAETYKDNIASHRVLEKAGFEKVREEKENIWWQKTL